MDDQNATPANAIEHLLRERAQYEQWLARLDSAGQRAPEAVRDRIRADYRRRLDAVVEGLRGHAATVATELERYRASQAELETEQATANERLVEAELRHAVGEYGDDEWNRIREETGRTLTTSGEALAQVLEEINRLEEVERLIARPPGAPPVAQPEELAEPPAPEPEPEPEFEPRLETVADAEPPAAGGFGGEDELAFLKSVTADAGRDAQPAGGTQAAGAGAGAGPATDQAGRSSAAKTLKCGECGTLNRPTEWYCERCGAELAAL